MRVEYVQIEPSDNGGFVVQTREMLRTYTFVFPDWPSLSLFIGRVVLEGRSLQFEARTENEERRG